ncbi:molybdate ABC transporter substrate-binding protein [Salinimonas marina]|uniref:Molybdate ABC transporter substrate-binding protein n=1 Tax=Salinimonas marina TaxID=2785918 RepID=A0A7S9DZG0_9ALTE|nr:molybdate ABC transporter substrate-binding protein [Salinimonas marina]QPG06773.1 molybdate ABC transporter substrate-binding protein [Salinimonas marina]
MMILWCGAVQAAPQPLHIAVAANFAEPARLIARQFTDTYHIPTRITVASSGTLYVQITHGAPFDVFLSADARRPRQLVAQQQAHADSLHSYARGQLVYLTRGPAPRTTSQLSRQLRQSDSRLAMANPRLAPYGLAAKQTLQALQLWEGQKLVPVLGKNVLQAVQYFRLNTVAHALVAASQQPQGEYQQFVVPASLYKPIIQQLVIPVSATEPGSARKFIGFLLSDAVQRQLTQWGYLCVRDVCQ